MNDMMNNGCHLRSLNVTFEERADGLLNNGVNAGLLVLIDLVQADIVFAVAGIAKLRHTERRLFKPIANRVWKASDIQLAVRRGLLQSLKCRRGSWWW
jgi:hypothetical protein